MVTELNHAELRPSLPSTLEYRIITEARDARNWAKTTGAAMLANDNFQNTLTKQSAAGVDQHQCKVLHNQSGASLRACQRLDGHVADDKSLTGRHTG